MSGFRDHAPVAAFTTVLLMSGCSSGGAASRAHDVKPTESPADPNLKLCDVEAYPPSDYSSKVGANLLKDIGTSQDGRPAYTQDEAAEATEVAKNIAPNIAAQSVIYTILNAEKGLTPENVTAEAGKQYDQATRNADVRLNMCKVVVGRLVHTPYLRQLQSPTGLTAVYRPGYDAAKNLTSINEATVNNTSAVLVMGIAAVKGSTNEARDNATAESWGVTADGDIIEIAYKEGTAKVGISGQPVSIKKATEIIAANPQKSNGPVETGATPRKSQNPGGAQPKAGPSGTTTKTDSKGTTGTTSTTSRGSTGGSNTGSTGGTSTGTSGGTSGGSAGGNTAPAPVQNAPAPGNTAPAPVVAPAPGNTAPAPVVAPAPGNTAPAPVPTPAPAPGNTAPAPPPSSAKPTPSPTVLPD